MPWPLQTWRKSLQYPLDKGKVKVKWSLYRPGVTQRVGIGIALLFHDRGTRRGRVVSGTPRLHSTSGKDPVPILQEAGWVPGLVWTGGKSRPHRDSIPDCPARSQSLYWLSYPAHSTHCIGEQIDPWTGHDTTENRKSSCPTSALTISVSSNYCPANLINYSIIKTVINCQSYLLYQTKHTQYYLHLLGRCVQYTRKTWDCWCHTLNKQRHTVLPTVGVAPICCRH